MKTLIALVLSFLVGSSAMADHGVSPCIEKEILRLSTNDTIQDSLKRHNMHYQRPQELDIPWANATPDSEWVQSILQDPASVVIGALIQRFSYQGEGFLIGKNGGLAAATNKTSDYYQGDEAQFLDVIGLPKGELWVEENIPDKSAGSLLIKVATPVYDTKLNYQHEAIGVLVVGLDQFVLEFSDKCHEYKPQAKQP